MLLSFSQEWPVKMGKWAGQPTHFVDLIYLGLLKYQLCGTMAYHDYHYRHLQKFGCGFDGVHVDSKRTQKIHTIRSGRRWKEGDKIHFCINPRSKDHFQFAPVMMVKGVQDFQIKRSTHHLSSGRVIDVAHVHIDNNYGTYNFEDKNARAEILTELAHNDGFESTEQFFQWFDGDFEGQIIHWTDLKY